MRALALVALAGCGVPQLKLAFHLDDTSDQTCGTTDCADIDISCGAVESIRIFDPAHPSAPYLSQCQIVPQTSKKNLCSLVQNTLSQQAELPEQTLAVEVVVYPEAKIPKDADGNLLCPTEVEGLEFDATGMPTGTITMQDPLNPTMPRVFAPAIGGRAFWHPGDSDVTVTLGCNDKNALDDKTCNGSQNANTTATVYDFDGNLSVSTAIAEGLIVSVGEPTHVMGGTDIDYQLLPNDTTALDLVPSTPNATPSWQGFVSHPFEKAVCLEVLDELDPQITAALTCKDPTTLDINGFRISKKTLDEILDGYSHSTGVPNDGVTIGVVYQDNAGVQGHVVSAATPNMLPATIHYLDKDTFADTGATATTESGIFIAEAVDNAPFPTTFSTNGAKPGSQVTAIGGNVRGKVTIVVLQFSSTPNQ